LEFILLTNDLLSVVLLKILIADPDNFKFLLPKNSSPYFISCSYIPITCSSLNDISFSYPTLAFASTPHPLPYTLAFADMEFTTS